MEGELKHQIVFFLTGRRDGSGLQPMSRKFRPALLARYGDLTSLRYGFPVVLNVKGPLGKAILSLSGLVDEAVGHLSSDRDRVARHAHRIERQLRRDLADKGSGDFAAMWESAVHRLAPEGDPLRDSAQRLWKAFDASGELADADSALPARLIRHAWSRAQAEKAAAFRSRADRLLQKLRDILSAELIGSAAGRTPERLRAGVGSSFEDAFDFQLMSKLLAESKPNAELSAARRGRIRRLIEQLEGQRFYPLESGAEPYEFAFARSAEALDAYRDRRQEAVELVKALAMADLEVKGDYHEAVHDALFEGFGANGLDNSELSELPDYLVCADTQSLDAAEMAHLVEMLAANLPVKVLVQSDDILEPSVVAEGHVALGLRSRQLVDAAMGRADVFVLQASASNLLKKGAAVQEGLAFRGPALFSVFSGSNDHTVGIPAYLVAAAAAESRAFPTLVYSPAKGSDWASRLDVLDNPQPEEDWPRYRFSYEDGKLQSQAERLSFTLADFMAMDDRFYRRFAVVAPPQWNPGMVPVPEAVHAESRGLPTEVPSIALVDDEGRLYRAIVDDRTLLEAKRCRTMWHSLQELGGIHNSHAERLLALERKARADVPAAPSLVAEAAAPLASVAPVAPAAAAAEAPVPAPQPVAEEDAHGDDPYIETARCTTCNECTQINSKMFAYNENKQAYIADPDAGTFRQLVEAAEGCQVSIIHPGKPRNPKEPGLEDLIKRAAEFN